jgi:hypothetical protein
MKTAKIRWDESMAVRCISRVKTGYVPVYVHAMKNPTKSFQTGEWDDFESKMSRETKKLVD